MRVLVTGATGSFGTPICRELAHRGVDVRAMARNEPERLPRGVSFVRGDIQDRDSVAAAVDGADAVLHLAWLVSSAREAESAERINIGGTQNVLDATRERGVPRFVFASSVMGYGSRTDHGPYREDEPLEATEGFLYGHHKKLVEARIKESGVPHLVVRTAPVVGRGVRNVVTDQFAGPAVTGMAGDSSLWQFVHSDDVTRFLSDAVQSDATGVVNLAADGGLSLERVAELLRKPVVRLPYPVAKAVISAMWKVGMSDVDPAALDALRHLPIADTTKLREQFGFRCAWSNAEAVADMRRSLITYLHVGTLEAKRRSYVPFTEPGWRPNMSPSRQHGLIHPGPDDRHGEFDDQIDGESHSYAVVRTSDGPSEPLSPLALDLILLALRASSEVSARLLGLNGHLAEDARSRMVASVGHRVCLDTALADGIERRAPRPAAGLTALIPTWSMAVATWTLLRNAGVALARYGRSEEWLLDEVDRVTSNTGVATLTDPELNARVELLIDTLVDGAVVNVNAAFVDSGPFTRRIALVAATLSEALLETSSADSVEAPLNSTELNVGRGERLRDALAHIARQLRGALQEKGARLTASGILVDAGDIFYLTIDEIAYPSPDSAPTVIRRKRQQELLASIELPFPSLIALS